MSFHQVDCRAKVAVMVASRGDHARKKHRGYRRSHTATAAGVRLHAPWEWESFPRFAQRPRYRQRGQRLAAETERGKGRLRTARQIAADFSR